MIDKIEMPNIAKAIEAAIFILISSLQRCRSVLGAFFDNIFNNFINTGVNRQSPKDQHIILEALAGRKGRASVEGMSRPQEKSQPKKLMRKQPDLSPDLEVVDKNKRDDHYNERKDTKVLGPIVGKKEKVGGTLHREGEISHHQKERVEQEQDKRQTPDEMVLSVQIDHAVKEEINYLITSTQDHHQRK